MNFCSKCGSKISNPVFPIKCEFCKAEFYQNPLPVAVAMIPVEESFLLIRRNIEPQKGKLAFPGGFVDVNETFTQGAVREVLEETGIDISKVPGQIVSEYNVAHGKQNLLFVKFLPVEKNKTYEFKANSEVTEIVLVNKENLSTILSEMAFPSHAEELKKLLA